MTPAALDKVRRWAFWFAMLALTAAVMRYARGTVDQAHVTLTMLLVVLGGSAAGGRALGVALSCAGFAIIDYLFQPPFNQISVDKPLDLVVLIAFLATAVVATDLLARARHEAEEARRRAREIAALARVSSEVLRNADPERALHAIAATVRHALDARACVVSMAASAVATAAGDDGEGTGGGAARLAATSLREPGAGGPPPLDLESATMEALASGAVVALGHDGTIARLPADLIETGGIASTLPLAARALALPLLVERRLVGVLAVEGESLRLDASQARFLAALTYYSALGVERVRLTAEAEHAHTLREASRMKDEVLASVSHDLRTPLTTIKALAQSAAARGDADAVAIEEQADRLAHMVGDLLDLSRMRAGGFTVTPELNTAEDLVGAAVRRARGVLNGRTIVTRVDLDAPALLGKFDFVHSLRILGNLLDNALRHSPEAAPVELGVRREQEWLVFTVSDRGPGVPAAERARIFEPFYRPASVPPDAGHAGLGLSVARQLATLQGGSLEFSPRAGGGSVFTLRLAAADLTEAALTDSL